MVADHYQEKPGDATGNWLVFPAGDLGRQLGLAKAEIDKKEAFKTPLETEKLSRR